MYRPRYIPLEKAIEIVFNQASEEYRQRLWRHLDKEPMLGDLTDVNFRMIAERKWNDLLELDCYVDDFKGR